MAGQNKEAYVRIRLGALFDLQALLRNVESIHWECTTDEAKVLVDEIINSCVIANKDDPEESLLVRLRNHAVAMKQERALGSGLDCHIGRLEMMIEEDYCWVTMGTGEYGPEKKPIPTEWVVEQPSTS